MTILDSIRQYDKDTPEKTGFTLKFPFVEFPEDLSVRLEFHDEKGNKIASHGLDD